MTDQKRAELRLKQDFLLMLVVDMAGMPEHLKVTEGGPSLRELRGCIWPQWESFVDVQLNKYATEFHVGVPNFEFLGGSL